MKPEGERKLKEPTDRDPPRSRRGRMTRVALLEGARTVFERDGFLDARISDIAAAAGVATGSFYTYFADKEDVFDALVDATQEEMLHPGVQSAARHDDPIARIEGSNRAYLEAYRRNAKLMRLFEQVSTIDEDFRKHRLRRSLAFRRRNARMIRNLQKEGKADPELDPDLVSLALGGMVSRLAYNVLALGGMEVDLDTLVDTATRLWVNALQIPPTGRD